MDKRSVAQLVARQHGVLKVAGSNPVAPTIFVALERDKLSAAVAQLVEYWPSKPRVAGSIPVGRSSACSSKDRALDF